ncbi:MAG: cation:proton antiporter [Acidobacteriaceae bacterium]
MIRTDVILASLALTVLCCWIGTLGAWRMRRPTQALHYLALPTGIGAIFLTVAIVLQTGWGSTSAKTIAICAVLIVTNSVGAHATARAIRTRQLDHWQGREQEGVEFIREDNKP